ncbi:MAG: hypothetical protein QE263_03990 [Vampirovibrionales bacterium]|nr:hypothetical protein [Vampirovibrionales bacterium]
MTRNTNTTEDFNPKHNPFVDELDKFKAPKMLHAAQGLLCQPDIDEDTFLGAQAILMLQGNL